MSIQTFKKSEIKDYTPCLGNISKDFTINDMKKKTILEGVDFNPIDNNDIFD